MVKIHHIRNATMRIEINDVVLLVDPMLSEKGTMPSYTEKRFSPQKNPIIGLPDNCMESLERVTHCLITHMHSDHLDKAGEDFLIANNIPVICSINDEAELKKRGLKVILSLEYWKKTITLGGTIIGIPATHGYGKVAELMGNVMGYMIRMPHFPSIYLSSDTIYTEDVKNAFDTFKPDIAVVAAGTARLDDYDPILMTLEDIVTFTEDAPNQVIANHLEAVNHCTTTRPMLRNAISDKELTHKIWIPEDGESRVY